MSLLQHAPRFERGEAAELCRSVYGLDAHVTPLPSERDQNFLVETAAGQRYVLKIANAREHLAALDAQNAAMRHLAPTGITPRVIPTLSGESMATADGGYAVRLLTWLPGEPLGSVPVRSEQLLEDLGFRLGQISAALRRSIIRRCTAASIGISRRRVPPSRIRAAHRRPWISRPRVRGSQGTCSARDGETWRRLPQSVIHGDANDYNVLVDGRSEGPRVSGVIDFGDMVHSYTVAEPAVAIAYAVLDQNAPLDVARAVVRGYHAAHPLSGDELSALFGLVQLRLCLSASIAAHQQQQRPG